MLTVPSQVVTFIDRAFPQLRAKQTVKLGERRQVAGLLALLDSIRAEHLGGPDPDQQYEWTLAVAAIRDALTQWSQSATGALTRMGEVGSGHPILALRDIMASCPDEAPTVTPTSLGFLADAQLQETLALDISTARSALGNGEYKAASVMAGSVIEALLLWAVAKKPPDVIGAAAAACRGRGERVDGDTPERWGLGALLCVAAELKLIKDETRRALDGAKDFRNLIHPGKAQRTGQKPTLATATLAVGAMTLLIEELS
jgi:hypothetical protein